MRLSHFTSNTSLLGFIGAELHLSQGACASATLGVETDPEALLTLIGIGLRAPPPPHLEPVLRKALTDRARGDTAMANIRLAYIPLPATPPDTARRIGLARRLLADGFAPYDLLEALDLDPTTYGLRKYDPDQPRVPSGQPEGGRWTRDGGAVAPALQSGRSVAVSGAPVAVGIETASETALEAASKAASGLFTAYAESAIPTLLGLALRFAGPVAFLGALVVPDANDGGVRSGVVPGQLGVRYNADSSSGRLTLSVAGADGQPITIVAGNKSGAYVDAQGRKVGVALGGGFVLDQTALAAALADQALTAGRAVPKALTDRKPDEPQACPDPQREPVYGRDDSYRDFEDLVARRVNPEFPTKRGYSYRFYDPQTGQFIKPDDCFRFHGDLVDGDMKPGDIVNAKSGDYYKLLKERWSRERKAFIEQAKQYGRVANLTGNQAKFYFEQKEAAEFARGIINSEKIEHVVIGYLPSGRFK